VNERTVSKGMCSRPGFMVGGLAGNPPWYRVGGRQDQCNEKIKTFQYTHYRSEKREHMDTVSGCSPADAKTPETIVSITQQFSGNGFTDRLHFYSLIVTDRRIFCVNTDGLIDARKKDAEKDLSTVDRSIHRFFERILRIPFYSTDFSNYFSNMHPDDIVTAHPDAEVIPLNNLLNYSVSYKFHPFFPGYTCLGIKITSRTKTPGITEVIELYAKVDTENSQNISALQKLLGDRFVSPDFFFGYDFVVKIAIRL